MQLNERVSAVAKELAGSQAKLAATLGMRQKQLNDYINRNSPLLWEVLPTLLKFYPQISRLWLYFGEGEMIKNPQQVSAADLAAAMPTPDIDKDVLRDVVRILEEVLEESRKNLSPDAKAEVICQLYQLVLETEDKASTSKPARMFRIISKAMAG